MSYMTAEELLAGSSIVHDIEIPPSLLTPGDGESVNKAIKVKLRPLTVRDIQRLTKASKDDDTLLSVLMLKESLVTPSLSFEQVNSLHAGLARFLVSELNRISGLTVKEDGLAAAVQAPLAKACFILAQEFGWSPPQVSDMTMGQILLYLEMLHQNRVGEE